jgi:hypothetical protein
VISIFNNCGDHREIGEKSRPSGGLFFLKKGGLRFDLTADDFEGNVDIAPRGMRIGTDFFVRFSHEAAEFCLR